MQIRQVFPGIVFAFLVSCAHPNAPKVQEQSLHQVSTIDALLQGDYDGTVSLKELSAFGDFGIGTVNGLDGELVIENGRFYQVKSDGKVYQPSGEIKTPFASVVQFIPEDSVAVRDLSFVKLKQLIDSLMKSQNYFYAIWLDGKFDSVRTRSVPLQQKPYPPLVVVTQSQPEFSIPETEGKLTGFFCPEFVKGINVPGYHLHYLADDKISGGHLLDFHLKTGMLKLDRITNFEIQLPETKSFQKTEYNTDRSGELKKAEG